MSGELDQARKAVRRGDSDEALVRLWNAVEPARLSGDRSSLATIGQLAERIARTGDASQQREAKRLLETLQTAVADGGDVPATARLDADLSEVGEKLEDEAVESAGESTGERPRSGIPFGTILWFLIILAVVAMNVARRFTE